MRRRRHGPSDKIFPELCSGAADFELKLIREDATHRHHGHGPPHQRLFGYFVAVQLQRCIMRRKLANAYARY